MPSTTQTPFNVDWANKSGNVRPVLDEIAQLLKKKRKARARRVRTAAAVLIFGALLAWGVPTARHTKGFETQASRQALILDDGSSVELSGRTTLKTDFRWARREARLSQGEAYFQIAGDSAHPFLVETPQGRIRVLGTDFDVRSDAGETWVTLIRGRVQIETADRPVVLAPGQVAEVTGRRVQIRTLDPKELDAAVAWREGRLSLAYLTLGEAAGRMAAYHGHEIRVDPSLAFIRMGGSCALDDLPAFLDFVARAHQVRVRETPDGGWRITPR